ncbi:MAG TPA: antibiotic biosynthesis monooxygenase [Pyrinomonadaceae bacterium]|nr:antibiotic biosynthesis monooxygenase [Pyrinomonadaceae bacterium]
MIARIWHGRTKASQADAYLEFLKERAVPDYQSTPGNRGVFLFRRVDGDEAHFLTVTHWDSLDAIEGFAGAEISAAKYYAEDADFLLEFEPTVEHYELYIEPDNTNANSSGSP